METSEPGVVGSVAYNRQNDASSISTLRLSPNESKPNRTVLMTAGIAAVSIIMLVLIVVPIVTTSKNANGPSSSPNHDHVIIMLPQ